MLKSMALCLLFTQVNLKPKIHGHLSCGIRLECFLQHLRTFFCRAGASIYRITPLVVVGRFFCDSFLVGVALALALVV